MGNVVGSGFRGAGCHIEDGVNDSQGGGLFSSDGGVLEPIGRGYIPKVFAFKNPYPLNPKESDFFYFLLIRMKRPKSSKFQRAVSSSSKFHAIQRIPRDTTTLAFLLILRQKSDIRGMRKYLHKVPTVLDFSITV